MLCPHCGHSVPEAPFCTNCGGRITTSGVPAPGQQTFYNGGGSERVRNVTFSEAVQNFFKNYATFSGRATRSEYWYATLFNFVISSVLGTLAALTAETVLFGVLFAGLRSLYGLAIFIPSLAICWRRFHDVGKSGAWYLMCLIPLVGVFIVLYYFCKDSDGDNDYGPRKTDSNRGYC